MKQLLITAIALGLALALPAPGQESSPESDVPVAPISAVGFEGWTNAFRLENNQIEVVVVPDIGRIARLAFKGKDNVLRLDETLKSNLAEAEETAAWMNFGGDWIWPVPQSRWAALAGKDWPPPAFLKDEPWTGTAWKTSDGNQVCLISRVYPAPLSIKLSRSIKLEAPKDLVTIHQRIERTEDSAIPVSLWNITQIVRPDQLVMPVDPESLFDKGYRVLNFTEPAEGVLVPCERSVVLNAAAGTEHKLGSDSKRAWIAARKGDTVIIEQTIAGEPKGGEYPDRGCTVELYSNAGLGYAEIETLSEENALDADESIENTLHIGLVAVPQGLSPCQLAERIRAIPGEISEKPAEKTEER